MHNTDSGTDRNITLAENWNMIGYSSSIPKNMSDVNFINPSGNSANWSTATSQGKVQAYLIYRENNVQRYLAPLELGMTDYALRENKGYWTKVNQSGGGTFNMPGVGGSLSGQTYAWNKLRFSDGTTELNITDAGTANWVDTTMWYYNTTTKSHAAITGTPVEAWEKSTFSPWEGVWIYSYKNNINMTRRN